LTFKTNGEFEFNVSKYDSLHLDSAMHTDELVENDSTILRLDYKVSGIGSNSCGPELLEKYRVDDKKIEFDFFILPR
ncbi:MAG: glycoside hydrolase family 2, partial [Oscillospiraceae bacterium]